MWQELSIIHREPGKQPALVGSEATAKVWRTCLRELHFLEPGIPSPRGAIRGSEAHRLLVEICSGLHSPLFGETEVFGQFRAFREGQQWDPLWDSFFDAVENDVRKLRRTFLTNLGSQSYGSLARRHLPEGEPVLILGGGLLTKDLLPWLAGFDVTVAVRNVEKARAELPAGTRILDLRELATPPLRHWLIAAPLENAWLEKLWAQAEAGIVLDFRGESKFSEQPAHVQKYLSLEALFREIEQVKALHEQKRREALAYARELSERRTQAVVHRPYGWEDAFA